MKCSECQGKLALDIESVARYTVSPKTGRIATRAVSRDERESSMVCTDCGASFYAIIEDGVVIQITMRELGTTARRW